MTARRGAHDVAEIVETPWGSGLRPGPEPATCRPEFQPCLQAIAATPVRGGWRAPCGHGAGHQVVARLMPVGVCQLDYVVAGQQGASELGGCGRCDQYHGEATFEANAGCASAVMTSRSARAAGVGSARTMSVGSGSWKSSVSKQSVTSIAALHQSAYTLKELPAEGFLCLSATFLNQENAFKLF